MSTRTPVPAESSPVFVVPPGAPAADRSLAVYPAAAAARVFPGWAAPTGPLSRSLVRHTLRDLAQEVERRFPAAHQVTLVYDTATGSAFGMLTVNRTLHGFYLPPLAEHHSVDVAAEMVGFAGRLARVRDADELKRLVANRRPDHDWSSVIDLPAADPDVTPTRVEEPESTIGRLVATYHNDRCRHIQVRGGVKPPQPAEVDRVLKLIFPLLFPGYSGPLPDDVEFESFVCRRVSTIQRDLGRLTRRAMAFHDAVRGHPGHAEDYREAANRIVVAFFDGLPQVRFTLDRDVRAAYKGDPALPEGDFHLVPMAYPGLVAVAIQRVAHLLYKLETPYLPRMMTEIGHSRTGIDIHPGARIGHGFFIDHGTGVVIGETSNIGNDVTLYQGVTLGAVNFPTDESGNLLHRGGDVPRHPTVQTGTTVFANAAILGDISVGSYSKIGSNVSLRKPVKSKAKVRLDPELRKLDIDYETDTVNSESTLEVDDAAEDESGLDS